MNLEGRPGKNPAEKASEALKAIHSMLKEVTATGAGDEEYGALYQIYDAISTGKIDSDAGLLKAQEMMKRRYSDH